MHKPRILFVCVENACRSQMAEAFARHYGGERIEAHSAGSRPRGEVDAQAIAVMRERGPDLSRHASKGLSAFPNTHWDVVVGMGCGEDCALVPAKRRIIWQIPDPARQPIAVYRQVRDIIEGAVKTLLEQLPPSGYNTVNQEDQMAIATASGPATERKGVVTFKGGGLTLLGAEVRVGDRAPDFQVLAQDLSTVTLAAGKGTVRIFSVVPSLDTPVCDAQTRRFNDEAAKLPGGVEVWTISVDLPFAQKRWCGAAGINRMKVLSDHREASFGLNYGCLVKELRLLARAIFVVDQTDTVRYVEYVAEVTSHPNYDRALAAARQLVN